MLKIYIGCDPKEEIAYEVCKFSILQHASGDVEICPLKQPELRMLGLYTRPQDVSASTDFSLTRFLTPYLSAYEGWSVFVDCDFLFTRDILALVDSLDMSKAIHVVQHDYTPRFETKMDGMKQTSYPRKNWSSFMIFNGKHPSVKALGPQQVNNESPAFLHRLQWVDDNDIGALDASWNFLVGEYPKPTKTPAAIHYTNGGPWFGKNDMDYSDLWSDAARQIKPEGI